MPRHQTKLILNPNADVGTAWRQAADLRPIVEQHGGADWAGTVYPTHAMELARQAAEEGYDRVIAVGGDGTVHEIVNGLMSVPRERRPQLGVVPLGSGNDFAFNIGMEQKASAALRQVLNGAPRRVDVGFVENEHGRREYWGNVLGIGFEATVALRAHRLPVLRGFLMYLTAVIQTIMLDHDAPQMQFATDESNWEAKKLMVTVCNGRREGGGFVIAPDASMDDGILNYVMFDDVSRMTMFRLVIDVLRGTHVRSPHVQMGSLRRLVLHADRPLYIHTDGEIYAGFGTNTRQLTIEVIPGAIEVLV